MVPRATKAERLVLTERLVEAGLTLIREAEMFGKTALARAIGVRNGLLIAPLALHPIRVKNFTALTIADTFINIAGRWWLQFRPVIRSPSASINVSGAPTRRRACTGARCTQLHQNAPPHAVPWQWRTTRPLGLFNHRPATDC